MSVAEKEIPPAMTDLEDIFPPKQKKPNPGWKKLEELNLKRYMSGVKKEWGSGQHFLSS